jgi:DNA-binding HxlR family transcriptional regulator
MDTEKDCTDPCPVSRALQRVGDRWSLMILRDASYGATRFDQFQKNLGIAPNILTRRLAGLVEVGVLEKYRYSLRPPRDEYRLTPPCPKWREPQAPITSITGSRSRPRGVRRYSSRGGRRL